MHSDGCEAVPSEIQLPHKVEEGIEKLGLDPKDPRSVEMVFEASIRSGILPPADELRDYEDAIPGTGEKIIRWADEAQRERSELRRQDFDHSQKRMNLSQRNAFIIAMSGLMLSSAVGIWGNMFVAMAIAVVAVGGPSCASILARYLIRDQD